MISAGSFSRLIVFEDCNRRAKIAFVDRIKEPPRGDPPSYCPKNPVTGEREWFDKRGIRVHDTADAFLRNVGPACPEMEHFMPEFEQLKKLFAANKVHAEETWAFTRDWDLTTWDDWDNCWMRIKVDAFAILRGSLDEPVEAVVIDYKTGKAWGNEAKHADQCQLYQLGAFKRFPTLETIHVEAWYLDQNCMLDGGVKTYLRPQGLRFQARWERRMKALTTESIFKPMPSKTACKWCPFRQEIHGGTGHCDRSVI